MSFFKLTIRDVPIDRQVVLVRVDYNVPLNAEGKIDDDLRIRASLPTLRYLLDRHCKVVITSHLGRPEGRDASLSLEPVAERLAELIGQPVAFVDECIGDKVVQAVKRAAPGDIILLENVRFHKEEEANDLAFAEKIAKATGARYFVQDCFGVAHRAHASIEAITRFIPSVAGFLIEKEYNAITTAMRSPERPLVVVMGGAKISDKIDVIEAFVKVADTILIGGAMANTFLAERGITMGASVLENDEDAEIIRITRAAQAKSKGTVDDFLVLPTDVAVAKKPDTEACRRSVPLSAIQPDDMALDIGDNSIESFVKVLDEAKTVIWNGTVGYAELPEFAHGSARIALELASHPEITSIIGGGDTADFVLKWDSRNGDSFTHVSTGGGASLELMAGKPLPGIESLLDARK